MTKLLSVSQLENIVVGRVEPRVYAFLTATVPRYLKVGDTYRPVPVRIAEWQRHFQIDAEREVWEWPAVLEGGVFFRDYSVHQFLQEVKGLPRLDKETLEGIGQDRALYYSNEFFLGATAEQVEEAMADIRNDHRHSLGKYAFYSVRDLNKTSDEPEDLPEAVPLALRPNQAEAVENFRRAVAAGRTNLLMFAVMRFGKTVTALKCAEAMDAQFVVVVSGKADVMREWRNTLLAFTDFRQFVFLAPEDLRAKYTRLSEELSAGHRVVLFATLQDLQGDAVKPKHRQLFSKAIDLLVIDETHFAARAFSLGKVLLPPKESRDDLSEEPSVAEAYQATKALKAKVRLHLSGTPYRVLMGNEFQPEDIVARCQLSDIVQAQQEWDAENLAAEREEWENPYYGFPQMVRFAFNLNASARRKLAEMEQLGKTSRFGELFRTQSLRRDSSGQDLHRKFVHEQEVAELFQAIGGGMQEEGILPFLDYPRIREGKMCRHIVCVLPYCASCDALETLLDAGNPKFQGKFGRLGEYQVLNISSAERRKGFRRSADIAKAITECEKKGVKTLTLTVNRMLTGSTIPEWDTMLYLKDTSSPQEYDQAIFRLQSSYLRTMSDGQGREIKYNLKPQTLLVDFDPARMFYLQAARAQCYNLIDEKNGNRELERRIARELEVSPVVWFNQDKIHRVEANDVMGAVSQYSSRRGVAEEAAEIPVDFGVFQDAALGEFLDRLPELGGRDGLAVQPHSGEETDLDGDDAQDKPWPDEEGRPAGENTSREDDTEVTARERRVKTFHACVIFFAFLTEDNVASLDDILDVIDQNEDNLQIAKHLGLDKKILERYRRAVHWGTLQQLDFRIRNSSRLANETETIDLGEEYAGVPEAVKKAIVAMRKFGRLGVAEIVTPPNIAYEMVCQLTGPEWKEMLQSGQKVLDLAAKMGEFAIAVVRRCAEADVLLRPQELREALLAIPTSGVAYEFTRKVYELLDLDIKCISLPEKLNTYDLLNITESETLEEKGEGKAKSAKRRRARRLDYARIRRLLTQDKDFNQISAGDDVTEPGTSMCNKKIGLVISNPPYQEKGASGGTNDAPIYQNYSLIGDRSSERYSSFIIKSNWFTGGRESLLGEFRKEMLGCGQVRNMKAYSEGGEVFAKTVAIESGVCYYLRDRDGIGLCNYILSREGKVVSETKRDLTKSDVLIREPKTASIVDKVLQKTTKTSRKSFVSEILSGDTPFGIPTNPSESKKAPFVVRENRGEGFDIRIDLLGKGQKRVIAYARRSDIRKNAQDIDYDKVFVPAARGGETLPALVIGEPIVAPKGSACSQTFIYAKFPDEKEAVNFARYLKTKFFRLLVAARKIDQHAPAKVYAFVPIQDFSEASDIDWSVPIPEIDAQLYAKYGLDDEEKRFIEERIRPME